MPEVEKIKEEIKKLEQGPTTYTTCEKLAYLYTVLDHMDGREVSKLHDYAEKRMMEPAKNLTELSKDMAMELAAKMENEDDTVGAHWTYDQVKNVMAQKGIDADPAEFYLAINMMYSDYCKIAKKLNVNTVDFYSGMAKAFLEDKDGGKDKLMRYFRYVVR